MTEIDDEIFNKNLLLTQAYCELQLMNSDNNPAMSLRTFNPVYDGYELFSYKEGNYAGENFTSVNWNINPLLGNTLLYPELFEKQLAFKNNSVDFLDSNRKFEGRILVAEIYQTVLDGASEVQSKGFVDINDCPPIDTWFYKTLYDNYWIFFAWVPKQYVELADNAVAVNCIDCLTWYEDWLLREKENSIRFKQPDSKIGVLKHIVKLFGK